MSLGTTQERVVREILSHVLVLVGIGIGASMWASQYVTALRYGLKSCDPLTLVVAVLELDAVGVFARLAVPRRTVRA